MRTLLWQALMHMYNKKLNLNNSQEVQGPLSQRVYDI